MEVGREGDGVTGLPSFAMLVCFFSSSFWILSGPAGGGESHTGPAAGVRLGNTIRHPSVSLAPRGRRRGLRTPIRATLLPFPRHEAVAIVTDHVAVAITLVACAVDCAAGASGKKAAIRRVARLEL